jgi:hypothetical protein
MLSLQLKCLNLLTLETLETDSILFSDGNNAFKFVLKILNNIAILTIKY